ncbi:MAG: hypothetical protein K6A34_06155 [Methanobrevibacter sp.]|nr:hypothetical protein [Methanobrevibacter sp.]
MQNLDIDIEFVKSFLTSKNISLESYTDEDLINLLKIQLMKIESETGLNLSPVPRTDIEFNFNFDSQDYNLKHYPVQDIFKVKVDHTRICPKDYILDKENGRLRFLKKLTEGEALIVQYTSKESDSFITSKILPLAYDMLMYELDKSPAKNASSIKENDVSINFDTKNTLAALINQRLADLKQSRRKPLTRML